MNNIYIHRYNYICCNTHVLRNIIMCKLQNICLIIQRKQTCHACRLILEY